MASTTDVSAPRPRTWRWYVGRSVVLLVIAAVFVGAWMLYTGVTVSLQAEDNLHATLFTIGLVDQFVHDNDRWPSSWDELEKMSFPSDSPSPANRIGGLRVYDWPTQSPHIRQCVTIDFSADANTIVNQNSMVFEAIKPIGPYYEYRDYGHVESLQATLKQSIVDGQQ